MTTSTSTAVGTQASGSRADRIESLLSARLFVEPQLVGDRLFFVSNLGGQLSLYSMPQEGAVPTPLLPSRIALQNPELLGGHLFHVLPDLGRILVMIDHDGDENYEPYFVPLDGGFPEPIARDAFHGRRSHLIDVDHAASVAYFAAESKEEAVFFALRADLTDETVVELGRSTYGAFPVAWTPDHARVVLQDEYLVGDALLYEVVDGERRVLYGTPMDEREEGGDYPLSGIRWPYGTASGNGLLMVASLHDDAGAPAYLALDRPGTLEPVSVTGTGHRGVGELDRLKHLHDDEYILDYNIDGCSWSYTAHFDEDARTLNVERVVVGRDALSGGVHHGVDFDEQSGRFAVSFCTATMPTQLYVIGDDVSRRTQERALGLDPALLSPGEDASFASHDGLRVSARLYLPSDELGYEGPRPLVYYVHGGPQGQERPNFAWFSMPLIQILTLEGFAVFVPNARGSTGYGMAYTKRVDRDWGGQDRLDHVHAMTEVLPQDERVDVSRAGVVGRSYGGYMTLTLAARHPDLWRGAVDMFGPYDLITFTERLPETWKPYFAMAVGDPVRDRDFLVERSPKHYISDIECPLLVIQGKNDPRVVEPESHGLVDDLRGMGRDVDYLMFEDEGHDVLKLPNRVRCYDAIVGFFSQHLS
ncbi:MAG: prolyl oligopeptidase family serine peptidase [Gaiellaceae bacterium]|jgi:dienelactone hydrolase